MAFTQADLTTIEQAIATGELACTLDGKSVTYRSIRDLMAARDAIRAELQAAGTISAPIRVSYASRTRD